MAEDPQEVGKGIEENRRKDKEAQMTEKRKHELRIARVSLYTALITAAGTILAALITATFKANTTGEKVNSSTGASTSVINNIVVGFDTFSKLSNPRISLQAAIPPAVHRTSDDSPPAPAKPVVGAPSQQQTTQAALIVDSVSTDARVLDSCFGIAPLKPQRILVEAVQNGYNISIRAQNTGKSAVSVWAEGLRQMNDNLKNEFQSGGTNLPGPSFHTFDKLDAAFRGGEAIQPGDSGPLTFEFSRSPQLIPGSTITLHANLDYILKDESGQFTFQHANLSCQNLPVMSTVKQ